MQLAHFGLARDLTLKRDVSIYRVLTEGCHACPMVTFIRTKGFINLFEVTFSKNLQNDKNKNYIHMFTPKYDSC